MRFENSSKKPYPLPSRILDPSNMNNSLSNICNKKLLVISHSYNNFQKDSIDSVSKYFNVVNVLVRTNPMAEISNFILLTQLERFKQYYKIDLLDKPPNVEIDTTPLLYIPTDNSYKGLGKKHERAVNNLVRTSKLDADLVHAHFTWSAGYVAARLREKKGIPSIVTAHGYDIYSLPFKDDCWMERIEYVLSTVDHIITVSRSNLACIQKLDVSTPVTVIPNGFRSDLFYPRNPHDCRKVLDLPQDKKIILTVGNLVPIKGQKHLIEAMRAIVRERKDVLCIIIGSGALRKKLEHLVRSLGLEDHVMLVGGKLHDEIPIWMNACDLFVLPSLRESFGVVQIEAMACGKPVVATRNGGSDEIITSEDYGILVNPSDSNDLAEKIQLALNREWVCEAILNHAERYTWDNIAEEIMNVYEKVLG